jgi:hypothetical protein
LWRRAAPGGDGWVCDIVPKRKDILMVMQMEIIEAGIKKSRICFIHSESKRSSSGGLSYHHSGIYERIPFCEKSKLIFEIMPKKAFLIMFGSKMLRRNH